MATKTGIVLGMVFIAHAATAQFTQQGTKLVGTGAIGPASQGYSVAISADGTTAIVGGTYDNSYAGAAWVYTRDGSVWTQQGSKLVGNDAVGVAGQGGSVAISADGNTAIVGGPHDSSNSGAAWVFTRSGGTWSQQGAKLVGTGAVGPAWQGTSVAISGDGATAIIGGYHDSDAAGAAWVFTRSGEAWSQQGSKLVGTDALGFLGAEQGWSVAISSDGNTAIVGGPIDDVIPGDTSALTGAAWVYTRSGGVWSQQGGKLVGNDAVGAAQQGQSVAISGDGNTAIVGGYHDSGLAGAAWVYTRSGGTWSQQGAKLIGSDVVGPAGQGQSVAISGNGTVVGVGGPDDNSNNGAAWVFSSATSFAVWVPVAAHTPGLNQSQWRSDLGLFNSGSLVANAQITFHGSSGLGSNATTVAAGAQSILTDVVGQLGGSGSGALEVTSDQPLHVTARTYNQVSSEASCYSNGTQGQDYPAVASSGGLGAGQSAYLAGLTENTSRRCNIGVVNVGPGNAGVLVELFDGAGTKLADYTTPLTQGQWAQETQPFKNLAGQTAMDRGYAKVTVQSGSGVFAFASVIDNITNDPTTITMQWPAATPILWVPVSSHTPGLNQSQWRSDLGLLNTGMATANVQMTYYGNGGIMSNPTTVPAGTQLILTDVVGQFPASGSGAFKVASDQPLNVTARTYNQVSSDASCYPDGTQGQDYPAVATGDGLAAGQIAFLAGLTENASYHCNIGVVDVESGAATVLVELFDGAGTKLADYTVSLTPGEWAQETQPFKNKAGETAMDRGYAKITVQSGSGVFAFASVIDNITNDPTTVAMQR